MTFNDVSYASLKASVVRAQEQELVERNLRQSLTREQRRLLDQLQGTDVKNSSNDSKANPMATTPTKKYRLSIGIETNSNDRGDYVVQRLLSVDLVSDDFAELVTKAHGHLELAMDK